MPWSISFNWEVGTPFTGHSYPFRRLSFGERPSLTGHTTEGDDDPWTMS